MQAIADNSGIFRSLFLEAIAKSNSLLFKTLAYNTDYCCLYEK